MKTTIEVEIAPFNTPNFVRVEDADTGKESTAIAINELDSLALERLCDDFRDEVFKKAGKSRPPQEAPRCSKCRNYL